MFHRVQQLFSKKQEISRCARIPLPHSLIDEFQNNLFVADERQRQKDLKVDAAIRFVSSGFDAAGDAFSSALMSGDILANKKKCLRLLHTAQEAVLLQAEAKFGQHATRVALERTGCVDPRKNYASTLL